MQPGQERYFKRFVAPHLDGLSVRYVGAVADPYRAFLLANASALLMPIRWREPFGMVMVQALACGTPVIAFPEGAAVEIVRHGENGWLAGDEEMMAQAIQALAGIEPATCRASVATRYSAAVTAARYERVYRYASQPAPVTRTHAPDELISRR